MTKIESMKRRIAQVLILMLVIWSCAKEEQNTMYVKGDIKGLKKGTLYLQKQVDSLIVSVDSVFVDGTDKFLLTDVVESPEMYYLSLGTGDKKIAFFGEKDTISVRSSLEKFAFRAKVSGSENQALLDEYYEMETKFNNQNLDLIKEEFEARKVGVEDSIALVEQKMRNWTRKRYLYTTNFAVTHGDYVVAPYLALTELENANVKLLDTIQKSLSPEVKASKYGKQLERFIANIQENQAIIKAKDSSEAVVPVQ